MTREAVHAGAAQAAADREFQRLIDEGDPWLRSWPRGHVGKPIAVNDVRGGRSYWMVPFAAGGRILGLARVDVQGRILTIGPVPRGSESVLTGLTAAEVREAVAERGDLDPGEVAEEPILVHDGPPGREAWLVETTREGVPSRWLFVTAGGVYQRRAGTTHGGEDNRE